MSTGPSAAAAVAPVSLSAPVRLLDEDGVPVEHPDYTLPAADALCAAYAGMVLARRVDEQASALVRQGRLAVYPSSRGQEACQVAAVQVLQPYDWLFPTYRDTAAVVVRGVDPGQALTLLRGTWHCGYDPHEHRVAPHTTPLATQLPHAVGVALAARRRGEPDVVLALCGDGATSEGDFHAALNFAAVFHAPVVFLVENNEYAISVPLRRQSAALSLAHKAIGYGLPGVLVDGNDAAALLVVLAEAVHRARAGDGPTLVEAHTYRVASHTNADDAGRYRSPDEVRQWLRRDPVTRLQTYLSERGLLTAQHIRAAAERAERVAAQLRDELAAPVTSRIADLFTYVYAEPTPQLLEQKAMLLDELGREPALENGSRQAPGEERA